MAVIDELVARLGFDVTGLPKVQAAAKAFEATKNSVVANAVAMAATAPAAAASTVAVAKVGTESRKSSRSVLLLSTAMTKLRRGAVVMRSALRVVLAAMIGLVAGGLKVAGIIAAVGAAFVLAGARAARARREFQLAAKGIGTSAQNLETATNILRYLGLGDGAEEGAKKTIGAINEILKTIRAGGDEADEARKKFAGLGIDGAFKIDPKTGQMRDATAVLLDMVQAYKQLQDQAAGYRKQADAAEKKNPKQAKRLRDRALDRDRKATKLADDAGIDGKLKVLIDEKNWKAIAAIAARAASERPTTSDKNEERAKHVAELAEEAGQKAGALLKAALDRLTEIGQALAVHVLPPIISILDAVIAFGKKIGLIAETAQEKADREIKEREELRAKGFEKTEETPQQRRNRTQVEAFERGRREDEQRYGKPTEAPLPPERPAEIKAGEPGKPGLPGRPGEPGKPGEPGNPAPAPVLNSLPARDKDTSPAKPPSPTRAIRDTQADLPSALEGLRRRVEERKRELPAAPRPDQGASAEDWRKKASMGADVLKGRTVDAELKVTPEATGFIQTFKDVVSSIPGIMSQVSPETNLKKMQVAAEQKTENDNRKYENIGNDQRTISPSITVQASGLEAVAAAVKNSVLGAISTKGANTSTGALTAP